MNESIERMRKLVDDNLVMGLRFQMNRELNELEREIEQELNSLAERTCKFVDDSDDEPSPPKCSVCGYDPGIYECVWYLDGTYGYERNYCPNCGCKVVGE